MSTAVVKISCTNAFCLRGTFSNVILQCPFLDTSRLLTGCSFEFCANSLPDLINSFSDTILFSLWFDSVCAYENNPVIVILVFYIKRKLCGRISAVKFLFYQVLYTYLFHSICFSFMFSIRICCSRDLLLKIVIFIITIVA